MKRLTPESITRLEPDQIFVFGSNLSGRHGLGAAKTAMFMGAIYGKSIGIQGQTYAIPTKDEDLKPLPLSVIKRYVDEFLEFTKIHPDKHFLVTKIGCGLAGNKVADIAPMFTEAENHGNIALPLDFWEAISRLGSDND